MRCKRLTGADLFSKGSPCGGRIEIDGEGPDEVAECERCGVRYTLDSKECWGDY